MSIDEMIRALQVVAGQVGGDAPVVLKDDGRGWEVEITMVYSMDARAVIE